jgi:DNA polymerase III alpha subunit
MIAVIEPFSNRLASSRRQSMEGQLSLFDLGTVEQVTEAEPEYPALSEFTQREKLSMEKRCWAFTSAATRSTNMSARSAR